MVAQSRAYRTGKLGVDGREEGGVYLITGGLNGMAALLALQLANTVNVKLILVLSLLRGAGINIRADGDRLHLNAPKGALTPVPRDQCLRFSLSISSDWALEDLAGEA